MTTASRKTQRVRGAAKGNAGARGGAVVGACRRCCGRDDRSGSASTGAMSGGGYGWCSATGIEEKRGKGCAAHREPVGVHQWDQGGLVVAGVGEDRRRTAMVIRGRRRSRRRRDARPWARSSGEGDEGDGGEALGRGGAAQGCSQPRGRRRQGDDRAVRCGIMQTRTRGEGGRGMG